MQGQIIYLQNTSDTQQIFNYTRLSDDVQLLQTPLSPGQTKRIFIETNSLSYNSVTSGIRILGIRVFGGPVTSKKPSAGLIINSITCLEDDEYIYQINFIYKPFQLSGSYKLQIFIDGSWEDVKSFSGPSTTTNYIPLSAKISVLLPLKPYQYRIIDTATPTTSLGANSIMTFNTPNCHIAGLYVNDFDTILSATTEQNDLLTFASNNGLTTLYLYDLTGIIGNTSTKTSLKNFNVLAKNSGILKMGGISGSQNRTIGLAPNSYSRLQFNNESSGNQKFDIFNLENEFWIYTGSGDPVNFSAYTTWLSNITNTLNPTPTDFDIYIGNVYDPTSGYTNAQVATNLVTKVNRIMYAMYIPTSGFTAPAWGLNYIDEKLELLSNAAFSSSVLTDIVIIFHGGENYMHSYFESHTFQEAYANVVDSYHNWLSINNKSSIRFVGYFIYAYQQVKNITPTPQNITDAILTGVPNVYIKVGINEYLSY